MFTTAALASSRGGSSAAFIAANRLQANNGKKDRSFYTEVLKGIRPDGLTLIVNNIEGPRLIPPGTYDLGDGFYDPIKRMICNYDGSFKRNME